jgi:hypothetical protein
VTLDDHGTHTVPYLFVAETSPRYAAVCGPHEGNRWGEWAPFVPLEPDPDRYAPEAIAARREYYRLHPEPSDEEFIDGVYAGQTPEVGEYGWCTLMREHIAIAALRGVIDESGPLDYDIAFYSGHEWRSYALGREFAANDLRVVRQTPHSMLISTRSLDDVQFLVGFHTYRVLAPQVTVIARNDTFLGAITFNYDDDRFFIAERGDALLRHTLWAGTSRGLEIINDPGPCLSAAGTHEYMESVQGWVDGQSSQTVASLLFNDAS